MDEQPEAALPAFKIFERWATAELGPDSPAGAQAIARQAWCEARVGHRAEACRLYKRALALLRATVGDENNACKQIVEFLTSECGEAELEGTALPAGGGSRSAPPRRTASLQSAAVQGRRRPCGNRGAGRQGGGRRPAAWDSEPRSPGTGGGRGAGLHPGQADEGDR